MISARNVVERTASAERREPGSLLDHMLLGEGGVRAAQSYAPSPFIVSIVRKGCMVISTIAASVYQLERSRDTSSPVAMRLGGGRSVRIGVRRGYIDDLTCYLLMEVKA